VSTSSSFRNALIFCAKGMWAEVWSPTFWLPWSSVSSLSPRSEFPNITRWLHPWLTYIYFKHLVVDIIRVFAAFTSNMDIPGSPDRYYANINTALNLSKNSFYIADTLLSDALLVKLPFWFHCYTHCTIAGVSSIHCLGPQLLGHRSSYRAIYFGRWWALNRNLLWPDARS